MTIQRIGTSEGMKDVPGVRVLPIISFAVVHNGIVSLCGITADPVGDVKVQTGQVLERIDQLLQAARTDNRNSWSLKCGWPTCAILMITILFGTSGSIDRILQYALASGLGYGGQAYWLRSW